MCVQFTNHVIKHFLLILFLSSSLSHLIVNSNKHNVLKLKRAGSNLQKRNHSNWYSGGTKNVSHQFKNLTFTKLQKKQNRNISISGTEELPCPFDVEIPFSSIKTNYEEGNVSIIVDSEAGPLILNDFVVSSHRFLGLTTTERSNSIRTYKDYDEYDAGFIKTLHSLILNNKLNIVAYLWYIFKSFQFANKNKRESNNIEGRYIKGDPLKGYYDFVITEGSYKFWAAFQLATAVLIIYSTFAAIYYSKVNPLVGDYDYVDYLGGARQFLEDTDFIDTLDNGMVEPSKDRSVNQQYSFLDNSFSHTLISKFKYSLNFVLTSIDKIPVSD